MSFSCRPTFFLVGVPLRFMGIAQLSGHCIFSTKFIILKAKPCHLSRLPPLPFCYCGTVPEFPSDPLELISSRATVSLVQTVLCLRQNCVIFTSRSTSFLLLWVRAGIPLRSLQIAQLTGHCIFSTNRIVFKATLCHFPAALRSS